jgi:hypothetical protein
MVSHLFFYQLTLIALVWLFVMLQWAWPSDSAAACPTTLAPPHGQSATVRQNPLKASSNALIGFRGLRVPCGPKTVARF